MKDIDQLIPDIQTDADKITKAFNSTMAKEFYKKLRENATFWYSDHSPAKNMYKRTMQLLDKAPYLEQLSDYEYRVSFSPEKLWEHSWVRGKNERMGSYEDIYGNDEKEMVLKWEEEGSGPFSQYHYKKGDGIFGSAIFYFMEDIDSMEISVPSLSISDEIKKDLINLMKEKLKKVIKKEYKEFL